MIHLVCPTDLMGPIKLRVTGIDHRLLQRELVCATIEQIPNRHLKKFNPLGFGLPVGKVIVGHAHKKPSSEARSSRLYLSGSRSQHNPVARLSHSTHESIPNFSRKNNPFQPS